MVANTSMRYGYRNPYQQQYQQYQALQARVANDDMALMFAADELNEALINNRSQRIEKLYENLMKTFKDSHYYKQLTASGNLDDKKARLILINIFNQRAQQTTGKDLATTIKENQSNDFMSGFWNNIIPGFGDKSDTEVNHIFKNGEFDHTAGNTAANIGGHVAGIAAWAGLGFAIGCCVKGAAAGSTCGPVGAAIGAGVGLLVGAISWLCS